jgi:hypothetical protein
MDLANKALCFALRNPPKGHKKVSLKAYLLLIIGFFVVVGSGQ